MTVDAFCLFIAGSCDSRALCGCYLGAQLKIFILLFSDDYNQP